MGVAANKRNNQRQDINLKITDNLLNSIYQKKINSFIALGSQAEYGSKFKKIKENSKTRPITRYGKTKIKIFKKIKIFCKKNKIRFVWLRVFSGYGPNSHKNWIINSTILKLINNQKTKFTTGRQIYNFIYVTDIVSGIIKCLYNRKATGIFNLASAKSYSIRYIVRLIFRKLKTKKKPVFGELSYRNDQVMKTLPSISKPKNKLKWQPTISIHKGLNKTINFLKKNNSN
jgi:nucleoside-diphosphate-sugar epimerase